MARELRFIPPRSLVEVTTRTIQSRFLLRPFRDLNEIVIGVIARAKARYPAEVCAPIVVSNHLQALVCPDDAYALACFMSYVNGNIAREARQHPHSVPKHTKRSPAPRFHASRWEVWGCVKESYRQSAVAIPAGSADTGVTWGARIYTLHLEGAHDGRRIGIGPRSPN